MCFNCVYFRELLEWIPLKTITVIQTDITVKTSSPPETVTNLKKQNSQMISPNNLLKHCSVTLNHPVYAGFLFVKRLIMKRIGE
jgi:hypothetical protein